jgi:SAM-dependent methyltransferase
MVLATQGAWNAAYELDGFSNWEMLPLDDLTEFLSATQINWSRIKTIVDLGCGRGLRDFILLLKNPELNRSEVTLMGIDFSQKAIETARQFHASLDSGGSRPNTLAQALRSVGLPDERLALYAQTHFECKDILSADLEGRIAVPTFDLVIDWMCFHEIPFDRHQEYIERIAEICAKFLVLNVFSRHGSSLEFLPPAVQDVDKHQFSDSEIAKSFAPYFEILKMKSYPEDLHPIPTPTDKVVAAKKAYLMTRTQSQPKRVVNVNRQ